MRFSAISTPSDGQSAVVTVDEGGGVFEDGVSLDKQWEG